MSDQKQAQALRILSRALLDMADVLESAPDAPVTTSPPPLPTGSQRNVRLRKDGTLKMWALSTEERDIARATVLGAFVANGGVISASEFHDVARSVGYDARGLASFSTRKSDLVQIDPRDRSKRRLTPKGYSAYRALAHLDQGSPRVA